ncbi:hypothetical protein CMO83_01815 [Candidatus Woesearchaeota archaeon]|mgnify:CR=1 FL=1|jgi:2-C-methyl-D-erythritol 4-phosphate cytidylyltransferase/2-C-methyl-D-erythritol 2,4-cyclodiphosphate synthase|nr:hypothetical protein [Candidatus Woesearchaeota archaeon]MDP6648129.1 2-C-methyl-D-erythritol 4-phosphate cytidylyltransferase [Candidatus Woesearchaeota archaeon]|tara:strand:- start:83169 stop:84332 length:1164 start_codon:yes stop_codon:yes gene_type:complete
MNYAIIVAAGNSKRMNKNGNKVFLPLFNKPIIYYTIKVFNECKNIDEIIIVTQKENFEILENIKKKYNFDKIKKIVEGGKERQDSVYNGLTSIKNNKSNDIVVVHNASNPLVREKEIDDCIKAAKNNGAAVVGFQLKDTIKKINNNFVERTIDRKDIFQVQTPQAVRNKLFLEAFENAKKKNLTVTDDVSLVELIGQKVELVPCSYENIKITTDDDLKIAEGILVRRTGRFTRIGIGQDSHKFSSNKELTLGGCKILNEAGFEANSDGDVILHALFNAISQAIGEKSLGYYADPMLKKGVIDSKEYIKVILDKLNEKNQKLNNVGVMIEASRPKLEPHTDKIKESMSKILDLEKEKIGITYTSGENLTAFGQGKGMQCFVVVTLVQV